MGIVPTLDTVNRARNLVGRMRLDLERFTNQLEVLRDKRYTADLDGWTEKVLDLDTILADAITISGLLATIRMKLYTPDLSQAVFEQLHIQGVENRPLSRTDFLREVLDASDYYKSAMYGLQQRAQTLREFLKYYIKKDELSPPGDSG